MASRTLLQNLFAPSRGFAMTIAAVLISAYLVACLALFLGAFDAQWDHRTKAFEALGSLVGLAAGWVFGKEVHRMEAQNAHDSAKTAQAEAYKGHQLAGAIRALSSQAAGEVGAETTAVITGDAPSSTSSPLQPLADLVDTLFPPASPETQSQSSAGAPPNGGV
ncbi:MAG: hypothetical protein QOE41_2136 [Mycobacterium sp.]|jgi:hypothetical protein|nr:hypothetical protein [Mycobacterium sp.]MDT5132825.1 hypothetical protein [Mycobacterium sp.]